VVAAANRNRIAGGVQNGHLLTLAIDGVTAK